MDLILACTSHPSSCERGSRRVERPSSSQRGRPHGTLRRVQLFKLRIRSRAGPSHQWQRSRPEPRGPFFLHDCGRQYGAKLWLTLDIRWRTLADLPVQQLWRPRLAAAGRGGAGRARDRGNLTKPSHFPEVGSGAVAGSRQVTDTPGGSTHGVSGAVPSQPDGELAIWPRVPGSAIKNAA